MAQYIPPTAPHLCSDGGAQRARPSAFNGVFALGRSAVSPGGSDLRLPNRCWFGMEAFDENRAVAGLAGDPRGAFSQSGGGAAARRRAPTGAAPPPTGPPPRDPKPLPLGVVSHPSATADTERRGHLGRPEQEAARARAATTRRKLNDLAPLEPNYWEFLRALDSA